MGLFGNLFDFNHDGKVEPHEEAMGLGMMAALAEEEEANAKKAELEDLIGRLNDIPGVTVSFDVDPEDLTQEEAEELLEELQEELDELEINEPSDPDSEAHEAWEERYDELEEKIEELQEMLDDMDEE